MQEEGTAAQAFCLVMTTTATEDEAAALARAIVQARLAACVQLQAIRSFYSWKGAACEEPECLLLIKTRAALFPALAEFIRAHHRYEVPEIVQLPIAAGSAAYLGWVAAQTAGG